MELRMLRQNYPNIVPRPSPDAERILRLGKRLSWEPRPLGRASFPERPVFTEGWWLVPVHEDHSAIPERSQERVQAIYRAGLRPRGFVIAH